MHSDIFAFTWVCALFLYFFFRHLPFLFLHGNYFDAYYKERVMGSL